MNDQTPYGIGLIGCGGFGLFCLDAFREMPEVRIAAVADVRKDLADLAAEKYSAAAYADAIELMDDANVDIVHVATPPNSHHRLVLQALERNKHVLCEKPLAMSVAEGEEMLAAAERAKRICPVNFVMRYNGVIEAADRVLKSGVLGRVLAGRLTNCATDYNLPAEHWFWQPEASGGIFIEHGVHFFDLYRRWIGPGRVVGAQTVRRDGGAQEDRVTCNVLHEGGALVSHYHGFDQILPMDRADHRLMCEMGDVKVFGWIPLRLEVDAAVDEQGAARLEDCCPDADLETLETFDGEPKMGRGLRRAVTRRVRLSYEPTEDKLGVYAESIRTLLADQVAYLRDPGRQRAVTETNGIEALKTAEAAARLAAAHPV